MKKYLFDVNEILDGEGREEFINGKAEMIKKNLYKVKNIIYHSYVSADEKTGKSFFTEKSVLGAIIKMPGETVGYTTDIQVLTITGDLIYIRSLYIIDIKTTRSVDKEIRKMTEFIASIQKEYKNKVDELNKITSKFYEEKRRLSREFDQGREVLEDKFREKTGVTPAFKVSELIKDKYINDVRDLQDYYDYNYIDDMSNYTRISISAKSVKYPQEGDFPGIIYREYDGGLTCYSNIEKTLKKQIKSAFDNKKKRISYDNIVSHDKYEDKLIKINVSDNVDIMDKTTSIGLLIIIDYKKELYNKEEVEAIFKKVKEIIPYA